MLALCVLLATLSLFLLLKLIYQRKLIRELKKQIDFLIDRDTQTEIMVEQTDGPIQALAASINHLLKNIVAWGRKLNGAIHCSEIPLPVFPMTCELPLATANGYIQLLQEQDLTGEQKEYVSIAGERISAVKLLLDQLFEFARIEANELKLMQQRIDINSCLRDVLAMYYSDFEKKISYIGYSYSRYAFYNMG